MIAATYLQIYLEISCLLVPSAVVRQRTKMQSLDVQILLMNEWFSFKLQETFILLI